MEPKTRRNLLLGAFLGVSLLIPSLILYRMAPRAPRGQQALVYFEPGMLPILKEDFNSAADRIRVIVFLSPADSKASDAAGVLQAALSARPALAAKVFLIWQPLSGADHRPPPNSLLALVTDPRVAQFADSQRVLSQLLKPGADAMVFPAGVRWDADPPVAASQCAVRDLASRLPR